MRFKLVVNNLGEFGILDSWMDNICTMTFGSRHPITKEWHHNADEVLTKIAAWNTQETKKAARSIWKVVEGDNAPKV
jgi:hypothetical protein